MKKLFIIGNGFDLAHGIPSSYSMFKDYFIQNYCEKYFSFITIYTMGKRDRNGKYRSEIKDGASVMEQYISAACTSGNWGDFESALGKLDFLDLLPDSFDLYGNIIDSEVYELNKQFASQVYNVFSSLPDIFKEWVDTIPINGIPHPYFANLIDKDDLFLTFNYTNTLETIYGLNNVFHIHGQQGGEKIIVGHGADNSHERLLRQSKIYHYDELLQLDYLLKKQTWSILDEPDTQTFLNRIDHNVSNVYSYGFGFSEADLPYIKAIIRQLDSDHVVWSFNDYPSVETLESFKEKIRLQSYYGGFDTFHDTIS